MVTVSIGDYSPRKLVRYIEYRATCCNEHTITLKFSSKVCPVRQDCTTACTRYHRKIFFLSSFFFNFDQMGKRFPLQTYYRTIIRKLFSNPQQLRAIYANAGRIDSNNYTQLLCKSKHAIRFVFLSKSRGQKTSNRQCVTEKQSARRTRRAGRGEKTRCQEFVLSFQFRGSFEPKMIL